MKDAKKIIELEFLIVTGIVLLLLIDSIAMVDQMIQRSKQTEQEQRIDSETEEQPTEGQPTEAKPTEAKQTGAKQIGAKPAAVGPDAILSGWIPAIMKEDHGIVKQAPEKAEDQEKKTAGEEEKRTEEPEYQRKVSKRDRYMLAKIAQAECETDPLRAKMLVVCVVLNRVDDEEFPSQIDEVIFQSGQFSPVSNGRWEIAEPDKSCYYAVDAVLKGWDESEGATYFRQTSEEETWHDRALEYVTESGTTTFYRER